MDTVLHTVIWEWCPQIHPGIATNRDGRLLVTDGKETVILPAPAAHIFEDMVARKTVRELCRP